MLLGQAGVGSRLRPQTPPDPLVVDELFRLAEPDGLAGSGTKLAAADVSRAAIADVPAAGGLEDVPVVVVE